MTIEELKAKQARCQLCKEYLDPKPILWGNSDAKIVSISQAPSLNVSKTGKPFSDKSGEKLRKEWYQVSDDIFYNPDNFYFTAYGKCYPGRDPKGGDRKPPKICAEIWLTKEVNLLKPKLFLVLGRLPSNYLFPRKDYADLIFNNQRLNGVLTLVLPHPSPLNIKWFKDHPKFETERLPEIRKYIRKALGIDPTKTNPKGSEAL